MIGIKTHGKDLKKYAIKIKYWIHQNMDLLAQIVTLIHPSYKSEAKPNAHNLQAAPKNQNQFCIFHQNFQN